MGLSCIVIFVAVPVMWNRVLIMIGLGSRALTLAYLRDFIRFHELRLDSTDVNREVAGAGVVGVQDSKRQSVLGDISGMLTTFLMGNVDVVQNPRMPVPHTAHSLETRKDLITWCNMFFV
jgi:hypothetical protein